MQSRSAFSKPGIRLQCDQQPGGGCRDLIHSGKKGSLIGFRGLGVATDLTHILDCRSLNFLLGCRWIYIEEGVNTSAHNSPQTLIQLIDRSVPAFQGEVDHLTFIQTAMFYIHAGLVIEIRFGSMISLSQQ